MAEAISPLWRGLPPGERYIARGDAIALGEGLESENDYFYARVKHVRFLNGRTRCGGIGGSVTLDPGQMATFTGGYGHIDLEGRHRVKLQFEPVQ